LKKSLIEECLQIRWEQQLIARYIIDEKVKMKEASWMLRIRLGHGLVRLGQASIFAMWQDAKMALNGLNE
jgi:hypothetical protein